MVSNAPEVRSEGFPHATKTKLDIVIIGASLGGLATALALKRLPTTHAHTLTLLERSPNPVLDNQGAGIVAGGDTLAFFKRYDRCDRELAVSSVRRQYLDKNGEIVHKEDMKQNMTSWDLAYYVLRANVDGLKSRYCEVPNTVDGSAEVKHLHGYKVTGLWEQEEKGGKLVVQYETSDNKKGSVEADLVIGADGPSSTIRSIFAPDVERKYAGYVALRGTVREDRVSSRTLEAFSGRFTFFHCPGIQILAYLIPGENGTLEPGKRFINFVYYKNTKPQSLADKSAEFRELMTDVNGKYHRFMLPPGKISPKAWEKQCDIAREMLPPQFAELVCSTDKPFVQAVTDIISPTNEFLDGRVILIGDALAGFRPHTAASTSQACFDAMILADMIEGKVERLDWKRQTLGFARTIQARGVSMGERSQHEDLPLSEHIQDRNLASRPRQDDIWPHWAIADLD
ncbi:FAD/NAD(P)-binding domain-containing protein [Macroventuria anomochaeta]|uniref:FAD/NAD(P)-binding domain-containing protein n=1 Tax=Macroventuria anomochaeta TaxID=301207 RepID=A0ACB6RS77_9PLEO|nr:FAD/NAD(P)-binding domain-containing protein [Macroventuria anomochaeta]KAF2624761.1 FAD/NAD(P)-binding domain-containing protein [Macroventuria anomochaeta]